VPLFEVAMGNTRRRRVLNRWAEEILKEIESQMPFDLTKDKIACE
jgi:hypothetical protein